MLRLSVANIRRLKKGNLSDREIAVRLGCHRNTVWTYRRAAGIRPAKWDMGDKGMAKMQGVFEICDMPAMESIPLAEAVLCVDCNVITRAKNGHCPVCESASLMNLANVLDRQADGEK